MSEVTLKGLKTKLRKLDERRSLLLKGIEEAKANLVFPCGCGENHKIKDCDVIQTHWYTRPHGCNGGDYWNEDELQIVCPATGNRNRVLVSYDTTKLEERFNCAYKSLFNSVTDHYQGEPSGGYWNNYFLKDNAEYYGLEVKNDKT